MPPKKKDTGPSKKTVEKKKERVIEDKTFGLKNKKGAKQQRFIQHVEKQVKEGSKLQKNQPIDPAMKRKLDAEKKKKEQDELNLLFRPVQQKISKDADPKSVLCAFFKQGSCGKGDKCKFSHDMAIERKAEKRSLYCDARDEAEDTMENWDEKKLEDVVNKKHAEAESKKAKTDIICKHFLTAIENKKYGWFWECPIGDKCIYRHALPPGFVLKQDSAKEDKKDEISIEELVEKERASLGAKTTKITLETFMAWKQRKLKEKKEKLEAEQSKKKANFTTGKLFGISGREMFTFNPEMADEDDAEADEILDRESESEDEEVVTSSMREWTAESVANVAMEADGSGTASTSNARVGNPTNHTGEGDITKSSEASALPAVFDGTCNVDGGTAENGETVPINEDLFDPDDLDDLDELEDDIGDLDMADQ